MGEKAASINDVARLAGVSPATVSNALTGRKKVSVASAARVAAAVKALDYRADPLASMLRSGEAKIVAMLVPDLDNAFFTSIVSAVEQCLGADDYEVIVASSHGDESVERAKLKAMLAWRPAGVIVVPCSDPFPSREILDASRTPYVVADRVGDITNADTVSIDNTAAGALAARHLVDLGHRKVLVAASSLRLANIRQRCAGAEGVLRARGLPKPAIVELGFENDSACRRLADWFDKHAAPTAVLALTNFTTLGVLTTAAEHGFRIPEDLSLIGFDDYAWMSARITPLTAISQPVRPMGRALWERLHARIKGDVSPPVHKQFACDLLIRASTAPPAGRKIGLRGAPKRFAPAKTSRPMKTPSQPNATPVSGEPRWVAMTHNRPRGRTIDDHE